MPFRIHGAQVAHQLDSVAIRELQVDERHIELPRELGQHRTGFSERTGLRHNEQIGFTFQNERQWQSERGVVVDEEEANR